LFPIRDLNPTRITPILTIGLIALNVVVFFFWQPRDDIAEETEFLYENAAIACELTTGEPLSQEEIDLDQCREDGAPGAFPDKNIWLAAVVSMFLHGSLGHLLSNMWFLWIFGNNTEEAYGTIGYLLLYFVTGFVATATFVYLNPEATVPLVGASGAIAGVLGAYLILFPTHRILTFFFFLFVQVPAGVYLAVWLLLQFAYQLPGVAWEAHVGGFIAGALITLPLRPVLLARVRRLHQPIPRYRLTR
jgi:membrane associated rhomboid family serine protease